MRPPPSHNVVNQLVILTLCLLMFGGTLGLGAVWVRTEIFSTANRTRALQLQLADVKRKLDETNAEVAAALDPAALRQKNDEMRLGLVLPKEIQVARVEQSPDLLLATKRNSEVLTVSTASLSFNTSQPVAFRVAAYR